MHFSNTIWRLIAAIVWSLGCGNDVNNEKSPAGPGFDVTVEPVPNAGWVPAFNDTWQWQLDGDINSEYDVAIYDVDLFETDEATVAALQTEGRAVICYFSAGSSENWRDDFSDLPENAMGNALNGWDGERWLDITDENVLQVMLNRLDLAVQKGCDGVEPDNVDGYINNTGFTLTGGHQLGYNKRLANEAHTRGLAVLLKNDLDQIETLIDYFDGALNEECFVYNECDLLTPFVTAGKPVFQAEYADADADAQSLADTLCSDARDAGFRTLILPWDLDDSFRISCDFERLEDRRNHIPLGGVISLFKIRR